MIEKRFIETVVSEMLNGMHNDNFESSNVNGQCEERFRMSWDKVREGMCESISKGFELLSGVNVVIKPEFLIEGIAGSTGNWMTNRFLSVIYLGYSKAEWIKELYMKQLQELSEKEVSDARTDNNDVHWKLVTVAQDLFPERVQEVLSSHNLGSGKGHRVTATVIALGDKDASSHEVEFK